MDNNAGPTSCEYALIVVPIVNGMCMCIYIYMYIGGFHKLMVKTQEQMKIGGTYHIYGLFLGRVLGNLPAKYGLTNRTIDLADVLL